jgi:hypothetical protein
MPKRGLLLSCIFLISAAVAAQDSLTDENALDTGAFNQTFSAGKKADDKNKLEYLPGIFFVSEADGYSLSPSGYGSDARFYGKAYLKATKADIGSLYVGCNFNYFLYDATDNAYFHPFYQAQKPDPSSISASLSELHVSVDVNKLVFIRIGKQLLSWGATYFWSPEDFINLQHVQASVLSVVDVRVGKPGVRIHVPIGPANLLLFTDFSSVIAGMGADSLRGPIGQAWRLDGAVAGVNLGTVGYISKNGPTHIGFDATGNVLATDVYGELALSSAKKNNYSPTYSYSMGASRFFGKEKNWTGRGEFYYNDTGFNDTKISTLAPGAFTPFYSGKYYAYGEISGTGLLSKMLDISAFALVNIADLSYSPTLQCTFDFPGVIPFTVFARYFGGRDDREFTAVFGGPAWQVGARIVVDL